MGEYTAIDYIKLLHQLKSYRNIPKALIDSLQGYSKPIFHSDQQNKYSEPMPWIGIYIALASLVCLLVMAADLLHGFKNKKLWFPSKYSSLNSASLSIIAVAIKLPMDLNNSMPGEADQSAKLGSMAFMCTIMANSLPSLVNMDNKELITNTIGLGVLVITTVVNVCIQIKTGVISYPEDDHFLHLIFNRQSPNAYVYRNRLIAIVYVVVLLVLLAIHICSALAVLRSKELKEYEYQERHELALRDLELQPGVGLSVEKLMKQLCNYWIMTKNMTPEFMAFCSASSSAAGVICISTTILHIIIMLFTFDHLNAHDSDYKWSIPVIFMIQSIGVILGTIAPFCRCFASLSFKMSIWDQIKKVFKVESHWTGKLFDWKETRISFPFPFEFHFLFRNRICKVVIENMKNLILIFCIGFQKAVVVACKMIALIPNILTVFILACFHCWKMLKVMFSALGIELVREPDDQLVEETKDLISQYYTMVLHEDMKLAKRTLKSYLKPMNLLIREGEKRQPRNLMMLLERSNGFEGVEKFDSEHVEALCSAEYLNCWSLPLVTLTSIAVSLPAIKCEVDRLLKSVSEGLKYVTLVEENLNATDEYVSIQRAAKLLWVEVMVHHKWLGNNPKNADPEDSNGARQVLEWYRDTAKNKVIEVEEVMYINEDSNKIATSKLICANSMYRIAQTLMLSYQDNIDEVSQDDLFEYLSSMISDILAACLTNLPQVIAMKCYSSVIEERMPSVHVAVQLFGETKQIIHILQHRRLPSLDPQDFPFIDKWRDYFRREKSFHSSTSGVLNYLRQPSCTHPPKVDHNATSISMCD